MVCGHKLEENVKYRTLGGICICMYVHTVRTNERMYVRMYVCMYLCVVCVHVSGVCMCLCVSVCLYTYV